MKNSLAGPGGATPFFASQVNTRVRAHVINTMVIFLTHNPALPYLHTSSPTYHPHIPLGTVLHPLSPTCPVLHLSLRVSLPQYLLLSSPPNRPPFSLVSIYSSLRLDPCNDTIVTNPLDIQLRKFYKLSSRKSSVWHEI